MSDIEGLLRSLGYRPECIRVLPDGRVAYLHKLIYTCAILLTNDPEQVSSCYDDRWCYADTATALLALQEWDPEQNSEPTGWHRHPKSGRRRPGGNATEEYTSL